MERNGFSDVAPSPKPHKKNIILQKHKVIVYLFVCLIVLFLSVYDSTGSVNGNKRIASVANLWPIMVSDILSKV